MKSNLHLVHDKHNMKSLETKSDSSMEYKRNIFFLRRWAWYNVRLTTASKMAALLVESVTLINPCPHSWKEKKQRYCHQRREPNCHIYRASPDFSYIFVLVHILTFFWCQILSIYLLAVTGIYISFWRYQQTKQ